MGIFNSLKKKAKDAVAKVSASPESTVENLMQKRLDLRKQIETMKASGRFKVDKMEELIDDYEEVNEDLLDHLEDAEDLDLGLISKLKGVRKEMNDDKKFIKDLRKFLETFEEKEEY